MIKFLDKFFKLEENNTNVSTEIIAGITIFASLIYLLAVVPFMFSSIGVNIEAALLSMAIAAGIGCILIGVLSNYPLVLTPGVVLVSLIVYTIFLELGYSFEVALTSVFISSILFSILLGSNIREKLINLIPLHLQLATVSGIGFLVAALGLRYAGVIVSDPTTLISFGDITSPPVILSVIGLFIGIYLFIKDIPGNFLITMIITAIIGLIMTFCGFGAGMELMPSIPKQLFLTHPDFSLFGSCFNGFGTLLENPFHLVLILFTFLILMFFDVSGSTLASLKVGGLVGEDNKIKRASKTFIAVGLGGIISALCGTGNLIVAAESAGGVIEGGRTGLTAVVTGILFFVAIFIAPLIIAIFTPPVTCSILVLLGVVMMSQMKQIDWDDFSIAAPVFLSIILMILTFSITWGIIVGLIVYVFINLILKHSKIYSEGKEKFNKLLFFYKK